MVASEILKFLSPIRRSQEELFELECVYKI